MREQDILEVYGRIMVSISVIPEGIYAPPIQGPERAMQRGEDRPS